MVKYVMVIWFLLTILNTEYLRITSFCRRTLQLPGQDEPVLDQTDPDTWVAVASAPFLDAERSHRLFRAFYVPVVSEGKLSYGRYHIVGRRGRT